MTTTTPYVAICATCGVRPFATGDAEGRGFTLQRASDGLLYCSDHRPAKTHASRPSPVGPRAALEEFEKTLAARIETLSEAIAEAVENAVEDAIEALTGKTLDALTKEQRETVEEIEETSAASDALDEFRGEVERGFATLRKALPARAPAQSHGDEKHARLKPVTRGSRHKGQDDLIADESCAESHEGEPP